MRTVQNGEIKPIWMSTLKSILHSTLQLNFLQQKLPGVHLSYSKVLYCNTKLEKKWNNFIELQEWETINGRNDK